MAGPRKWVQEGSPVRVNEENSSLYKESGSVMSKMPKLKTHKSVKTLHEENAEKQQSIVKSSWNLLDPTNIDNKSRRKRANLKIGTSKFLKSIAKQQTLHNNSQMSGRPHQYVQVIDDLDEIREIHQQGDSGATVLSDLETRLLYQAKCKDLSIPNIESQYYKFRDNMLSNCTRRMFRMSGG